MSPRVLVVLVVFSLALLLGALGAWLLVCDALRPVAGPVAPLIASGLVGGTLLGARALLDRRSPPGPPAGEG